MESFNILSCITFYGSIYPRLKLNILSFDTKHDILWTMFKGQWPLTPRNYICPTPNPAHFLLVNECWHPYLPISIEIRLDTICLQIKPNFVIPSDLQIPFEYVFWGIHLGYDPVMMKFTTWFLSKVTKYCWFFFLHAACAHLNYADVIRYLLSHQLSQLC